MAARYSRFVMKRGNIRQIFPRGKFSSSAQIVANLQVGARRDGRTVLACRGDRRYAAIVQHVSKVDVVTLPWKSWLGCKQAKKIPRSRSLVTGDFVHSDSSSMAKRLPSSMTTAR